MQVDSIIGSSGELIVVTPFVGSSGEPILFISYSLTRCPVPEYFSNFA
jgi:hypothetical protein